LYRQLRRISLLCVETMFIMKLQLLLLSAILLFLSISCSSEGLGDRSIPNEITENETFISRPRFNKPLGRPLSRVQISWDGIETAEGYEVQMSETESFNTIHKKLTIRGRNLELPIDSGAVVWFRIRAFNTKATSEWSSLLKVEEREL